MIKMTKILILPVLTMFFFQGCLMSTKTYTPGPFKMAGSPKDKALIYIYRPDSILAKHVQWKYIINGKEIRPPLLNNGYIFAKINEGTIKVIMKQEVFPNNTYDELNMNIKKGKTYYIKASPGLFDASTIQLVEKEQGSTEIKSSVFYIEDK